MERILEVQVERHAGYLLLRVKGDLRLWNNRESEVGLLRAFKSEMENSPKRLLLSLREVSHIDTRGIRALVHLLVECSRLELEMELTVVMPPGGPGEAIRYVRIFEAWPKFTDEAEAAKRMTA